MDIKDLIQMGWWVVASVAGLFAAFRGIEEMMRNRRQQQAEHRWRQADLAKTVLDEISSCEVTQAAMLMLDWTNREYEIRPGETVRITRDDVLSALRTDNLAFDHKEAFIRDSFDELLDGFQRLEHYIDINLIHFEDVRDPVEYYVEELTGIRGTVDRYLSEYDFTKTEDFLSRFDFWKKREVRGREPCLLVD